MTVHNLACVGFGPAGVGLFTGALGSRRFEDLLAGAPVVLERGLSGVGRLGRYGIDSDSFVESFVAALTDRMDNGRLVPKGPWAQRAFARLEPYVEQRRGGPVPLEWADEVQQLLADVVQAEAEESGHPLDVRRGVEALSATRTLRGTWEVALRTVSAEGCAWPVETVEARALVLAGGAVQRTEDLASVEVGGIRPWTALDSPVIGSDVVLARDGAAVVRELLRQTLPAHRRSPRVVIVGGSHSAMAAATVLLSPPADPGEEPVQWGDASIAILHRDPLRPMYPSVDSARAEGFTDFGDDDLCPSTLRVLPLAGFRAASRELLLRIKGYGGRTPERRVRLVDLTLTGEMSAQSVLRSADLVILATGYRRESLPLFDVDGEQLPLAGVDAPGRHVDARSRVLDVTGERVGGVYATGLATGFPMAGRYGEPSFTGAANGTALWQTEIGADIVEQCLTPAPLEIELREGASC